MHSRANLRDKYFFGVTLSEGSIHHHREGIVEQLS